jgi:hypothetical protein
LGYAGDIGTRQEAKKKNEGNEWTSSWKAGKRAVVAQKRSRLKGMVALAFFPQSQQQWPLGKGDEKAYD